MSLRRTFTLEQIDRYRRLGDVADNGVVFHSELAGPQGMSFTLIREPHHTDEDLAAARRYLYNQRDVVGRIGVAVVAEQDSEAPEASPMPRERA